MFKLFDCGQLPSAAVLFLGSPKSSIISFEHGRGPTRGDVQLLVPACATASQRAIPRQAGAELARHNIKVSRHIQICLVLTDRVVGDKERRRGSPAVSLTPATRRCNSSHALTLRQKAACACFHIFS